MKQKIVLSRDFKLKPEHKEKNTLPSVTVPNESYTIQEIMERFVKGAPVNVKHKEAVFAKEDADFDSHDLEKIHQGDIVERMEVADEMLSDLKAKEADLKDQQKKQAEALRQQKEEDEELRKELRERKKKGQEKSDTGPQKQD